MFEKFFDMFNKFSGLSSYVQGTILLISHIFVAIVFFVLGMTLAGDTINVYTKDGKSSSKQSFKPNDEKVIWGSENLESSSPLPSDSGSGPT